MIYCWAKNLNTTVDDVLYNISYDNLVMYSSATPQYDDEEDNWDDSLDANNPENFKGTADVVYI